MEEDIENFAEATSRLSKIPRLRDHELWQIKIKDKPLNEMTPQEIKDFFRERAGLETQQ